MFQEFQINYFFFNYNFISIIISYYKLKFMYLHWADILESVIIILF